MVLHVPLPYDHGRDSALGVRAPCPRAGGLGGPSPTPRKQGGVGGLQAPHLLSCESTSRNAAMHSHSHWPWPHLGLFALRPRFIIFLSARLW